MNITTVTGIVGVINPTPDIVTFVNTDGVAVLTIRHDGRIEVPADIDPSEAGRLAAEAMGAQLATTIRAAVEAEREACAQMAGDEAKSQEANAHRLWPETADREYAAMACAENIAARIRARGAQ